jgi:poly-gamma-glutamate synthesis protein (capsule biosynthesis protein)
VGLRLDFCHTRLATGADADWIASRLARACEELGTAVERTGEARLVVSG